MPSCGGALQLQRGTAGDSGVEPGLERDQQRRQYCLEHLLHRHLRNNLETLAKIKE